MEEFGVIPIFPSAPFAATRHLFNPLGPFPPPHLPHFFLFSRCIRCIPNVVCPFKAFSCSPRSLSPVSSSIPVPVRVLYLYITGTTLLLPEQCLHNLLHSTSAPILHLHTPHYLHSLNLYRTFFIQVLSLRITVCPIAVCFIVVLQIHSALSSWFVSVQYHSRVVFPL